MKTVCRSLLAGSGLLCAALALAGCESIGQGMAESDARADAARYAAQGNPQFTDPALRALVADFEAKYAIYGVDPDKLGLAEGIPCPASQEAAFKALRGISYAEYLQQQAELSATIPSYTGISDLESVKLVSLSGVCGPNGPEGPAVVVGTTRDIARYKGENFNTVKVIDSVVRVEGSWSDGQPQGSYQSITISQAAQFKPGEDGKLESDIDDWAYLNEIRQAPMAAYVYVEAQADGQAKRVVGFSRNLSVGIYGTTVTEYSDATHAYLRSWQGTELQREGGLKDGKMHGWQISHPMVSRGMAIPGRRDCYQNGELIKALECPSS